jgi:hypothetical protein
MEKYDKMKQNTVEMRFDDVYSKMLWNGWGMNLPDKNIFRTAYGAKSNAVL